MIFDKEIEKGKKPDREKLQVHFQKIEKVDKKIGKLIRSLVVFAIHMIKVNEIKFGS